MNKKVISINGIDEINIYEFKEEDEKIIDDYIYCSDKIHFIDDFYNIFVYNYNLFNKEFKLFYNDRIVKKNGDLANETEVNAHIINIVSTGKTIVDLIDTLSSKEGEYFKNEVIRKIYDESFSYKLLYYVRNYSQHGYIPVVDDGGFFCFDLNYILSENGYKGNTKAKKSFEEIRNKLLESGEPKITCVLTVLQYIYDVIEIYNRFFEWIKQKVLEKEKMIIGIIKDIDDEIIPYKVENDMLISFQKNLGITKNIEQYIEQSKKDLDYFKELIDKGRNSSFESL